MKNLMLIVGLMTFTGVAMASDGETAGFFNAYTKAAFYFLAVAIASYGGTRSQATAAAVALEGMARNPAAADKLFVPMILSFALIESLVIFSLITVFLV